MELEFPRFLWTADLAFGDALHAHGADQGIYRSGGFGAEPRIGGDLTRATETPLVITNQVF